MKPALRKNLKQALLDKSHNFGIDKILCHSFVRQVDEGQQASNQDFAYAISALLEAPHHLEGEVDADVRINHIHQCLFDNFQIASTALDPKNVQSLLGRGVKMAMDLQAAIVRIGKSLIERNQVKVS